MRRKFTLEHAIIFNELHSEKDFSLRQIAKLYGTTHGTIKSNLEEYGFEWKSRKYRVDERFFSSLDTFEKQYFLGWLYSDGCIFFDKNKRYYGFFIKIQERDQYILEYLRECMCSEAKISSESVDGRRYSKLSVGSKNIYNDLLRYGLKPRKTHFLTYPDEYITDHRPFILGLLDGDGFIFVRKNKMLSLGMTGTKEMMARVNTIISNELDLQAPKLIKTRNSYTFTYTGTRNVQKVGEWLYSWDPKVFLNRKRDCFEKVYTTPKYGKKFIVFKCPQCRTIDEFEKRYMYMLKNYKFKSKFCSLSCSATFYRRYQLNNYELTLDMKLALKGNIVNSITRYKLTNFDGGFVDFK